LISGNPTIEHLINGPLSAKEDITVSIEKAVNFSVEVRRISKILWPHHKESITCYCFRHQFSSDMKKSKMGDDISRALGHATDKTRKRYGHASQGRGLVTDVVVTAPRPIKSATLKSSENSPSFT
jgi:integrase